MLKKALFTHYSHSSLSIIGSEYGNISHPTREMAELPFSVLLGFP